MSEQKDKGLIVSPSYHYVSYKPILLIKVDEASVSGKKPKSVLGRELETMLEHYSPVLIVGGALVALSLLMAAVYGPEVEQCRKGGGIWLRKELTCIPGTALKQPVTLPN